jgi:plasmid stability protein
MAQLVVRGIENGVKVRLQRGARRNGRSMEEEIRDILRAAVHDSPDAPAGGLGTEISKIFAKHGLDTTIPELRFEIRPPSFEE